MEFNKNKVIFGVVGVVLLVSIAFLLTMLNSNTNKKTEKDLNPNVKIWMVGDAPSSFSFIDSFKQLKPEYASKIINVETFSTYSDYIETLKSAMIQGEGPDIFVLNNNDNNDVILNQVVGISPSLVNPNDFRKKYKTFFYDLIESYTDGEGILKEQLIGIPVGYEVLGIFYSYPKVKRSDLSNKNGLDNLIVKLQKNDGNIPIGIGNGTTVYNSQDIITQFLMLQGATSYAEITGNVLNKAISSYLFYGDTTGINGYNSKFEELKETNKDSTSLFVQGKTSMIIGYPSLIKKIKEAGSFSKTFLQVAPFPHDGPTGKTLVNYNYFVINSNSKNTQFAQDLLAYLSTDTGVTSFLNDFPFLFPGILSLEEDRLVQKIDPDYNVLLGDFFDDNFEHSSFDKGIKTVYDRELPLLLDNVIYRESSYKKFVESLNCKVEKIIKLSNFGAKCE